MNSLLAENQGIVYFLDDDWQAGAVVKSAAHELGYDFKLVTKLSELAPPPTQNPDGFSHPDGATAGCLIVSDLALAKAAHSTGHLSAESDDCRSDSCRSEAFRPVGGMTLGAKSIATIVICGSEGRAFDVQRIVGYMRAGAVTILPTPLDSQDLKYWIVEAIEVDRVRVEEDVRLQKISRIFNSLTKRKRCVLQHMIDGRASKWSAHQLDVSRRTIELDRAEILNAFGVSNAIELARLTTETKCLPLNYTSSPTLECSSAFIAK